MSKASFFFNTVNYPSSTKKFPFEEPKIFSKFFEPYEGFLVNNGFPSREEFLLNERNERTNLKIGGPKTAGIHSHFSIVSISEFVSKDFFDFGSWKEIDSYDHALDVVDLEKCFPTTSVSLMKKVYIRYNSNSSSVDLSQVGALLKDKSFGNLVHKSFPELIYGAQGEIEKLKFEGHNVWDGQYIIIKNILGEYIWTLESLSHSNIKFANTIYNDIFNFAKKSYLSFSKKTYNKYGVKVKSALNSLDYFNKVKENLNKKSRKNLAQKLMDVDINDLENMYYDLGFYYADNATFKEFDKKVKYSGELKKQTPKGYHRASLIEGIEF